MLRKIAANFATNLVGPKTLLNAKAAWLYMMVFNFVYIYIYDYVNKYIYIYTYDYVNLFIYIYLWLCKYEKNYWIM